MSTIYDFKATAIDKSEVDFSQFKGKTLLIVNTASKCGFTPQYEELEKLYQKYKDQGFVVIGFPCDQFKHQEPGTEEEIQAFCTLNYGVTFPMMSKIEVNGENTHPLYVWLKKKAPGILGNAIKWNFAKFLVQKDGTSVERFAPTVTPFSIIPKIEEVL